MAQDEGQAWDRAWDRSTVEGELATLDYEWVQPSLRFVADYLAPGALVLEAGCGPGRFMYWLGAQGHQVVGLDVSAGALGMVREHSPGSRLVLGDARRLPFRSGAFDACLSFGVLEHFAEGPDAALAEAHRILAPGGVLVLSVPHTNLFAVLDPPLKRAYRGLRRLPAPTLEELEPPGRHQTRAEVLAALRRSAFEILAVRPMQHAYALHSFCGFFRKAGAYHDVTALGCRLGALLARIAPWSTAPTVFVAARKA